jgi:hypothetical protein
VRELKNLMDRCQALVRYAEMSASDLEQMLEKDKISTPAVILTIYWRPTSRRPPRGWSAS